MEALCRKDMNARQDLRNPSITPGDRWPEPTHDAMAALKLRRETPPHELAADLRRAFSGIVAGNVKESGLRLIDEHGPFELHGDPQLLKPLDALLASFVRQRRMKLSGDYRPCYRIVA